MSNVLIFILQFAAGFLLGSIIAYSAWRLVRKPDGYFLVNLTDPEDDMFSMQIDIPLEELPKAKYLIFKVKKIQ